MLMAALTLGLAFCNGTLTDIPIYLVWTTSHRFTYMGMHFLKLPDTSVSNLHLTHETYHLHTGFSEHFFALLTPMRWDPRLWYFGMRCKHLIALLLPKRPDPHLFLTLSGESISCRNATRFSRDLRPRSVSSFSEFSHSCLYFQRSCLFVHLACPRGSFNPDFS